LYVGGTYLWRGAAFEYTFSSDEIISISYMPPYHLIYTTGPLGNTTIGGRIWIIYVYGERPLYVIKQYVYVPWGDSWSDQYFVFKLTDVTPNDSGLNMWLPQPFAPSETLSDREYYALNAVVPVAHAHRVLSVEVNGTHMIFRAAGPTITGSEYSLPARLPSPVSGRTIRVTNTPLSSSYTINGTTFTIIALPYQYFSISPTATTNLVIYVS
jgi:hypothetical protein